MGYQSMTRRMRELYMSSPQEKLMLELHHIRRSHRGTVVTNSSAHRTPDMQSPNLILSPFPYLTFHALPRVTAQAL